MLLGNMNIQYHLNDEIILIEDEIDIDSIEEFIISDKYTSAIINEDNIRMLFETQNEIIKSLKQLNRKIREER